MTIQITGNDAQFNKDITILGDLEIYGSIKSKTNDTLFDFSDNFVVKTNETERLRITSDGKVGIGIENPSHLLHLQSASSPAIKLEDTTNTCVLLVYAQDADAHVGTYSDHDLIFDTDSTEKLRIRSDGNVNIVKDLNVTGIVTATSFSGSGANLTGIVGVPTGCILAWGGGADSIPTGFLLCKGDAISRSTYATLFVAIGTLHGSGDGSSTFNLPDLKNRFVVGGGTGSNYSVGDTGGADSVTLSVSELPAHTHTHTKATHPAGSGPEQNQSGGPEDRTNFGDTGTTSSTGGGSAHENRPPYYALCYIIKT